jgi:two-component system heavy metal sensor histidine kinase CusS
MKRRSITRRLAILFALVSVGAFLALGLYLAQAIRMHFAEMDHNELKAAIDRVARVAQADQNPDTLAALQRRLDALLAGHDQVAIWIARDNGERVQWHAQAPYPETLAFRAMTQADVGTDSLFVWERDGRLYRGTAARVPVGIPGEPPLKIWAALNIDHHEHFMTLFERALWAAILAAIFLSTLLGVVIARSGMVPVRTMAAHARRISTARLGERIDTRELPLELLGLAEAFNDMLARLNDSFQRLSAFSSDIAHELRTPVSNLLTETQVILSKARSADAYRDVLASNAEELERLARMVSDMLFLAKADNGLVVPSRERVDLAAEVRDLFDFYDALAEQKALSLTVEGEAVAEGDRLMLRRVINNLLSNAVRHTSNGGHVQVRLAHASDDAVVSVFNAGEPIPPEVLPRLFERFYRADVARHRSSDGAGLGLAISRSIVAAHGGEIRGYSGRQGTTFEVRLPRSLETGVTLPTSGLSVQT